MLIDETTKIAMESGRLLIVFHINEVHQLNPNATHVTNNYYGEEFVPDDGLQKTSFRATCNPQLSRDSILEYVMRLHPSHVCKEWRDKYRPLWVDIIEQPAVADKIFDKGKQQNTSFNRNLVGNILHLLAEKKILNTTNATRLSEALENDPNASIRAKLGEMPPPEIRRCIEGLI
jgi:hypothetical protein